MPSRPANVAEDAGDHEEYYEEEEEEEEAEVVEDDEWVLKAILARKVDKKNSGQMLYQCQWVGFEDDEPTWETREFLEEAGYIPQLKAFDAAKDAANVPRTAAAAPSTTAAAGGKPLPTSVHDAMMGVFPCIGNGYGPAARRYWGQAGRKPPWSGPLGPREFIEAYLFGKLLPPNAKPCGAAGGSDGGSSCRCECCQQARCQQSPKPVPYCSAVGYDPAAIDWSLFATALDASHGLTFDDPEGPRPTRVYHYARAMSSPATKAAGSPSAMAQHGRGGSGGGGDEKDPAARLMARWRERYLLCRPVLVFHGTRAENLHSICENGLFMGGTEGINVANGGIYGRGIYTFANPRPATTPAYAKRSNTVIACAALVGGGTVDSIGHFRVVRNRFDVCPLFVLQFGGTRLPQPSRPLAIAPSAPSEAVTATPPTTVSSSGKKKVLIIASSAPAAQPTCVDCCRCDSTICPTCLDSPSSSSSSSVRCCFCTRSRFVPTDDYLAMALDAFGDFPAPVTPLFPLRSPAAAEEEEETEKENENEENQEEEADVTDVAGEGEGGVNAAPA